MRLQLPGVDIHHFDKIELQDRVESYLLNRIKTAVIGKIKSQDPKNKGKTKMAKAIKVVKGKGQTPKKAAKPAPKAPVKGKK